MIIDAIKQLYCQQILNSIQRYCNQATLSVRGKPKAGGGSKHR